MRQRRPSRLSRNDSKAGLNEFNTKWDLDVLYGSWSSFSLLRTFFLVGYPKTQG
jgi:hypothetical protein